MISISNIAIIQKYDELYFGSDSAVSVVIEDNIYRLHENGQKIFIIDKYLIFCSGVMNLAHKIITEFKNSRVRNIEMLRIISQKYYKEYINNKIINTENNLVLEVIVGTIENNQTVIYQISPYNDFDVIIRKVPKNSIGLWTGGIKTEESYKILSKEVQRNKPIKDIYKRVFNDISFEGIGGNLSVYRLGNENIKLYYKNGIKEKDDIKRIVVEGAEKHLVYDMNLIVGERIYGRIFCGQNLTIQNEEGTFLVNPNGVTIDNMALQILATETGNNGIEITPSDGLIITKSDQLARGVFNSDFIGLQHYSSGDWQNLFFVDESGNLQANNIIATNADISGVIDCSDLKLNGVSIMDKVENTIDGAYLATNSVNNDKIISLNADKITAGTITGITIQTNVPYNDRIVLTNDSLMTYSCPDGITDNLMGIAWGTEVTTTGFNYGDVYFYDTGIPTMQIYNNLAGGGWTLKGVGSAPLGLGFGGTSVLASGTWNFSNVTDVVSAPSGTPGLRKITISSNDPSGGADGDIWLKVS